MLRTSSGATTHIHCTCIVKAVNLRLYGTGLGMKVGASTVGSAGGRGCVVWASGWGCCCWGGITMGADMAGVDDGDPWGV